MEIVGKVCGALVVLRLIYIALLNMGIVSP